MADTDKTPEPDPEVTNQIPFDWNKFLDTTEVKQALVKLPDLWKEHQNSKQRGLDRSGVRFISMTLVLFVIILATVILLTVTGKISSEATSFLLGVIITGAISVVRDFTGGK